MHLILHIPHASTAIPDRSGYVVNDATLAHELLLLTDWHTDDLYANELDTAVVAPFSAAAASRVPRKSLGDDAEATSLFAIA